VEPKLLWTRPGISAKFPPLRLFQKPSYCGRFAMFQIFHAFGRPGRLIALAVMLICLGFSGCSICKPHDSSCQHGDSSYKPQEQSTAAEDSSSTLMRKIRRPTHDEDFAGLSPEAKEIDRDFGIQGRK
jgi:hypothetical protein